MAIAMARRSEAHMLWVFRSRPSITALRAAQEDQSVTLPLRIFAGLQGPHPHVFILGRAVAIAMTRRSEAPMLWVSRPSITAPQATQEYPRTILGQVIHGSALPQLLFTRNITLRSCCNRISQTQRSAHALGFPIPTFHNCSTSCARESTHHPPLSDSWKPVISVVHAHFGS